MSTNKSLLGHSGPLRIVYRCFGNIPKEWKSCDKDYMALYKPKILSIWLLIVCWSVTVMRNFSSLSWNTLSSSGCAVQTGFSGQCISKAYCLTCPLELHIFVTLLLRVTVHSPSITTAGSACYKFLWFLYKVFSLFFVFVSSTPSRFLPGSQWCHYLVLLPCLFLLIFWIIDKMLHHLDKWERKKKHLKARLSKVCAVPTTEILFSFAFYVIMKPMSLLFILMDPPFLLPYPTLGCSPCWFPSSHP